MGYYLCKYCHTLTNHPVDGLCEESPMDEHEWLSGEEAEAQIQMVWDRSPSTVSAVSERSAASR